MNLKAQPMYGSLKLYGKWGPIILQGDNMLALAKEMLITLSQHELRGEAVFTISDKPLNRRGLSKPYI